MTSTPKVDRAEQKRQVIARIQHDRDEILAAVHDLRRPMLTVQRWQHKARKIAPVVPGLLLAAGVTVVLAKMLFGGRSTNRNGLKIAPRIGFFGLLLRAVSAYRIASQVRSMVQTANSFRSTAPEPRYPVPQALPAPMAAARATTTHYPRGDHS